MKPHVNAWVLARSFLTNGNTSKQTKNTPVGSKTDKLVRGEHCYLQWVSEQFCVKKDWVTFHISSCTVILRFHMGSTKIVKKNLPSSGLGTMQRLKDTFQWKRVIFKTASLQRDDQRSYSLYILSLNVSKEDVYSDNLLIVISMFSVYMLG